MAFACDTHLGGGGAALDHVYRVVGFVELAGGILGYNVSVYTSGSNFTQMTSRSGSVWNTGSVNGSWRRRLTG